MPSGDTIVPDPEGPLTLDQMALTISAARQGLGIAYVLEQVVAGELEDGTLRRLLPDWKPDEDGCMLHSPAATACRRRVAPSSTSCAGAETRQNRALAPSRHTALVSPPST